MPDPTKIQFDITGTQRLLLIQYLSVVGFTSWLEEETKTGFNTYRISVDIHEFQEMIDHIDLLIFEADEQMTKDQLRQLAVILKEQQTG